MTKKLQSPLSIRLKECNNLINVMTITSSMLLLTPKVSNAAAGAFEMDMDYYLRNIINGNDVKKENEKKVRKSIFPSPRQMDIKTTTKIIDIIKTIACKMSSLSIETLNEYIDIELPKKLVKFKEYIPITNENFSDQYYFDIYLYLIYKAIENVVSKSEDRVKLRQKVGDEILQLFIKDKLINMTMTNNQRNVENLAYNVKLILQSYVKIGLISSFIFDDDDLADQAYADSSFQEGLPVSFQFTLKEPATLLGFIEQNKNDTFYHPEIIASTIASYCRQQGFNTRFEDYLVDNYYRTENFDIEAQDILIEMLIK
jgi:hypothetical protein